MNLGIQIDSVNTGSSGVEAAANATGNLGNPGNPANAGELFGQLMVKAMQLQSQTGTLPGQTEAAAASAQLTEDGLLRDMVTAKDTEEAGRLEEELTLSLPDWLQAWPGMPSVQQISVGPSMQAITAGNSTPDAQGVADFARQQGLDADAIAWLMNPITANITTTTGKMDAEAIAPLMNPASPQSATTASPLGSTTFPFAGSEKTALTSVTQGETLWSTPVAGSALLPLASLAALNSNVAVITPAATGQATLAQGEFPGSGAWLQAKGLRASSPEIADSTALAAETDAATSIVLTQMNRGQTSVPVQFPTSLEAFDGETQGANLDSTTNVALAQLRWSQANATAPVNPAHLATVENMEQEPVADATTSIALAQLRWSQANASTSLVHPARAAQAVASGQPSPSSFNESTLDLTALFTTESELDLPTPSDPLNSDLASPSGSGSGMLDAAGWHRASGNAAHARAESASQVSSNSTMTPDQLEQMSEQMADAIGERMLREIERGHWNVRLMLKPAHLGHIEVEMRLRAGELDATFAAPQAATRELLQDGLSRLKDSLAQAGMDVANLHVRDGQNRQNGGDSTPGQRQFANNAKTTADTDVPVQNAESPPRPRRTDGWDVMV